MANWCEGTLKVRGEEENIRRFLTESFVFGDNQDKCHVEEVDEWTLKFKIPEGYDCSSIYLKGTYRNGINSREFTWETYEPVLMIENYIAAWCVDVEALTKLSKQYQIDFKIYGFECGAAFNIDFEVHKGSIIKCEKIKFGTTYEDYVWGCLHPERGG